MSTARFGLEESIRQSLRAVGDRWKASAHPRVHLCRPSRVTRIRADGGQAGREATAHGDGARTGDTDRTSDPLALDPLSPIAFEPRPEASAGPLALDPLSPLPRDPG